MSQLFTSGGQSIGCLCPSKFIHKILMPAVALGGGAFRSYIDGEGRALMNGVGALIEETPAELAGVFHPKETPGEGAIHEPGRRLSPQCHCAGTLILDLAASITVRNKCLLFVSYLLWGIL